MYKKEQYEENEGNYANLQKYDIIVVTGQIMNKASENNLPGGRLTN